MSYPPDRYLGEDGEVSATLRRATAPPDIDRAGRRGDPAVATWTRMHHLASGAPSGPNAAVTDGDYGLYGLEMGPRAGGPGPHFHRSISEAFYVLEGTVRVFDGDDWQDARVGDFLHVPPGGLHGFSNDADEPATVLLLFTPGAPREDYFERLPEVADMHDGGHAFFRRHDNHWR